MFRFRWVLAGFLMLPIAELAVFLTIASEIGVLPALSILLASSLVGAAVLRGAGRGMRSRFRGSLRADGLDGGVPGVLTMIAGILLLVPGFLTDIAGILLLIPALQRRVLATLLRNLGEPHPRTAPIVELGPDQWQRVSDEDGGKDLERRFAPHSCPPAPAVLATPPESGSSASRVKEER